MEIILLIEESIQVIELIGDRFDFLGFLHARQDPTWIPHEFRHLVFDWRDRSKDRDRLRVGPFETFPELGAGDPIYRIRPMAFFATRRFANILCCAAIHSVSSF